MQNFQRLDLEEGNSAFDVRQSATGNWVLELPFGPNRAFFNKGGVLVAGAGWFFAERDVYVRDGQLLYADVLGEPGAGVVGQYVYAAAGPGVHGSRSRERGR